MIAMDAAGSTHVLGRDRGRQGQEKRRMTRDEGWDREVDLLVAGAGPGGMTAALVAALEGLDVLICEKSEQVGGTGATSAGTLWIPGNGTSREAGFDDSADDAGAYLDALIGDGGGDVRREAYLADGPRVIDDLVARTELRFVACGRHPDYRNNLPGAALSGRAIIPDAFDGRRLGRDFRRVRPPIDEFMLFGGMMVGKVDIGRLLGRYRSLGNLAHSVGLVLRYLLDRLRHARGTRLVMGNALVAQLFLSLKNNRVPVLFGTALDDLVSEDGRVTGAVVKAASGPIRVRVRGGVVLATGGLAHNEKYRQAFMPKPAPAHSMAVAEDTGDGLEIGERIGARLDTDRAGSGGLWSPVSLTRRGDGSTGMYPHLVLDRAKPGLIAVNGAGRRFVNEGVSYHDFVEAMYRSNEVAPTIPAHLICDSEFVRRYGIGAIHPGTRNLAPFERSGYATCADSLEALAEKLGIDAAALADTVARHNRFAADGSDPDFGKGDTELNRFNGDPQHVPNPCLGSIAVAPFVAVDVWPADLGCTAGLATNADAQVLDHEDQPIGGLYACGNDMGSIMAGTYPGPGTTLGPAMVFGYRAAMHAARARLEQG
jgi:succinate dehydrogenase/fumarate reductase flavoprotein subunit